MIQQTPWIERNFNFDFPIGVFPCLLERLRYTPLRVENMIASCNESVLTNKPNGKWSIKELIGHLATVERLWEKRLAQFLEDETELCTADMSNQKTEENNFNNWEIEKLLILFIEVRKSFVSKLDELTEQELGLTALHPRLNKPMRLLDMIYFIAEHDDNELALMRAKIKK